MNLTSNKRAGRKYQTTIANIIGGKSVGTIEGQDISHEIWSVEAKKRKSFVAVNWMNQCIRNCPEGKTPVVMVHITGKRHETDLVIMTLKDWTDWHGYQIKKSRRKKEC